MAGSLTAGDLSRVYSSTYKARNKWSNILLALNVSNDTIESIGRTHRDNVDDCYRVGLSEWLSSGSGTWKDMAEALAGPTVGHNDVASGIEKEYLQPTGGEFIIMTYSYRDHITFVYLTVHDFSY